MVAKSHLDLGFTALAAEVEARYLRAFFPSAIATAAELRRRGGPQLVWTTGSWILSRALADPAGGAAVAALGGDSDIISHLPYKSILHGQFRWSQLKFHSS